MKKLRHTARGGALIENALLICGLSAFVIPAVWTLTVKTNAAIIDCTDFNSHSALPESMVLHNPFVGEPAPAGGPDWHQGDPPQWP